MDELKEQIRGYIVENMLFGDDSNQFRDDTSFLEEGIVDSTGVVELVMFVEERYGLTVRSDEIVPENFDSVASLAAYVSGKTGLDSANEG